MFVRMHIWHIYIYVFVYAYTHKDLNLNENMYCAVFKVECIDARKDENRHSSSSNHLPQHSTFPALWDVDVCCDKLGLFTMRGGGSGLDLGW